jgi:phage tail-like protein
VRGTIEGLASPHPLAELLPGLYQDDTLVRRFTSGLDEVLAPVLGVLDSAEAYLDPQLAPLDFVAWLAQWVGVELDAAWPEDRQRTLVAWSAVLYAWRGTVRGLAALIEITTGLTPEIDESGGTAWTADPPPAGDLPGDAVPTLVVRLRARPGETLDLARLDRLVAGAKPAHVGHRVEILDDPPPTTERRA